MSPLRKGLLLAAIQLAIVLSLGVKLLYDRMTRPRVWVLCQAYDPELPIRGRYLAEGLHMFANGFAYHQPNSGRAGGWWENRQWAYLRIENGQLMAFREGTGPGEWVHLQRNAQGALTAVSEEPVLLFIPENTQIPVLAGGEEMWIEVTIPKKGPPRPIRMGIKKNGILRPLEFN